MDTTAQVIICFGLFQDRNIPSRSAAGSRQQSSLPEAPVRAHSHRAFLMLILPSLGGIPPMLFRLANTEYDRHTARAYVEFRASDGDGGNIVAVTIFSNALAIYSSQEVSNISSRRMHLSERRNSRRERGKRPLPRHANLVGLCEGVGFRSAPLNFLAALDHSWRPTWTAARRNKQLSKVPKHGADL